MNPRYWKRLTPGSYPEAIKACLDYAMASKRLSVERVAARVGVTPWAIYKWLSDGSVPGKQVVPFEHVCGCHYITKFQAYAAHLLVVDIPTGQPASEQDLLALQSHIAGAVQLLADHYQGKSDADETIGALTQVLEDVAGHRENVAKEMEPELALFDGEDGA